MRTRAAVGAPNSLAACYVDVCRMHVCGSDAGSRMRLSAYTRLWSLHSTRLSGVD